MNLCALMKVRNEQWILPYSLRAALHWVDSISIVDHASTDNTREIVQQCANEHPDKTIAYTYWDDPEFREMDIYQHLMDVGRDLGATHFVTLDADEVLSYNKIDEFRKNVAYLPQGQPASIPFASVWGYPNMYRCDEASLWANRIYPIAWVDDPALYYRVRPGEYDWHARLPKGWPTKPRNKNPFILWKRLSAGAMLHYAWVDLDRIRWKAAHYKMVEWVRFPGCKTAEQINRKYDVVLDDGNTQLALIPPDWLSGYGDLPNHMTQDYRPWFLDDIKHMIALHGHAYFAGLDLHDAIRVAMS